MLFFWPCSFTQISMRVVIDSHNLHRFFKHNLSFLQIIQRPPYGESSLHRHDYMIYLRSTDVIPTHRLMPLLFRAYWWRQIQATSGATLTSKDINYIYFTWLNTPWLVAINKSTITCKNKAWDTSFLHEKLKTRHKMKLKK